MQPGKSPPVDSVFREYFKPSTILDILRYRAEHQSRKTAYTYLSNGEGGEISLTYGEVNLRAKTAAAGLVERGLRGERALLLYPPGLEFIEGFFACLYAGLIAIPVYAPDPARLKRSLERLEAIAADAKTKVVLTTTSVQSTFEQMLGQLTALKPLTCIATDAAASGSSDFPAEPDISEDSIAFLQYTSGSTGKPRGVMLTHSNLIHNAAMIQTLFQLSSSDTWVSWLPTFHDMGFMAGVLEPLYLGIPAINMSPSDFVERPARWLKAVSRYKATISGGPNFAYDLCVAKTSAEERASIDLSNWEVAFNGSEPLSKATLERFARAFEPSGFRKEALFPCYGLAEATLLVTCGQKLAGPIIGRFDAQALSKGSVEEVKSEEVKSDDQRPRFLISCGRPSQDQRIAIINPESRRLCSPHEVGEIWVRGPSVAQGYWNNPDATRQTFHAHTSETGEGPFLRTGDLGFVHDGELFITSRLKDLIIIRGVNHHPQDIERTAETSDPALRPSCVAAFSVSDGSEEKLVIVQEVNQRKQADLNDVIARIRQAVTENHDVQVYAVVLLKAGTIPKTSSGKIQRSACRQMFLQGGLAEIHRSVAEYRHIPAQEDSFIRKALLAVDAVARQPLAESYLLEEAAALLRISRGQLRKEQPLSVFGLDSLTALEFKHRIETQLGISLSASKLLAASSVEQIASLVLDQLNRPVATRPSFSIEGPAFEYPLSFTQRAFWFYYQLAPESAAYNTALAIRITERIDVAALQRAFQSLIDRHGSLRTTFAASDAQPVQRVHPWLEAHIRQMDASALTETELRQAVSDEAYRPFDLERGPVYRASLFGISPDEQILLLAIHHIVTDGWSFWVLLDELIKLYTRESAGAQPSLPPPAAEYADYIRWQVEMLRSEEGERLFQYWKQEISGDLPSLNLPTLRARPVVQTYSAASFAFSLNGPLVSGLKELALRAEVTPYMFLLAVYQILLHRYTGQDDLLVGSPISARSLPEFSGIVGCLINAVILRADFSEEMSFLGFLNKVRSKVLAALDHQDYPSYLLAERLQPVRDPSRPPLFQTTFILQKPQRWGADLAFNLFSVDRKHMNMEIELEMMEGENAIHAWLHYNKDLFNAAFIARMADHYRVLVEGVLKNPEQRLSTLRLLTDEEVEGRLAENVFDVERCKLGGLEEWFLEQAKGTPDKIAAIHADHCVSYNELDDQSNRLAALIKNLKK